MARKVVLDMNRTFIAMTSITYAMKAKELCLKNGIRCEVVRTPKNIGTGCGYSISARVPAAEVIALLDKHKIPHRSEYMI
jgi:hypothetical protein